MSVIIWPPPFSDVTGVCGWSRFRITHTHTRTNTLGQAIINRPEN